METIILRRSDWEELEGKWQELVLENYHPDYNGMGELYHGITTAEEKIENMKPYVIGIPVWGAWSGERLAGVIMGKISGERLVIYDMFVSSSYRRQGIGRQLVQLAVQESGARIITAEINRDNAASQELFKSLSFQPKKTSDWLGFEVPDQKSNRP